MSEELRLQTHDKPTMFNKEMAIGGLAGLLMPIGFITNPLIALAAVVALPVGGAVVGGLIGEARIEKEYREGKIAKPPTAWNKDTVIGALGGVLLGDLAAAVVAVGIVFATGAALAPLTATLLTFGGLVGGGLLGGYLGGESGKNDMALEYERARKQPEVIRQPGYSMQYSTGHAAQVERQIAQSQERTR
jgi:hypothetical protein